MTFISNRNISDILSETAKLMELHGVNEFKTRSVQNAAFVISRLEKPLAELTADEISQIKGIGKSICEKVQLIMQTGSLPEYETFVNDTPAGVIEMMRIKGIGPKKVAVLWKQLGVESPGELLYACNENRLVELKGFGNKTQEQVRKTIEYTLGNKGLFHYAALESLAKLMVDSLSASSLISQVSLTGPVRRKCEILQQIDIIAGCENPAGVVDSIAGMEVFKNFTPVTENTSVKFAGVEGITAVVHLVPATVFYSELFLRTGSVEHLELLRSIPGFSKIEKNNFNDESEIYAMLGLSFIEPELREGRNEVELAKQNNLPVLIDYKDLKGCLHNHSTYSDGLNSLREMAFACRDAGYEYLGICDHSKSAFYANGLREDRVKLQHEEIDRLNAEMAPFRVFKGIESDILNDGSLDYDEAVLQQFEFIVASVHSGLKMNAEKATARLVKAISNPYTTILGHPTGRLLLAREGYPVDHKTVIDSCAKYGVVIELNAHPYRLDLDWRWLQYAMDKGVMISVNPDAHHVQGIKDMYFGVCAARKGGLTQKMTFNCLSREAIDQWFIRKREMKIVDFG